MSYLYQYNQPGVRIENIKEINGFTYVLGWEYNSNQNPKVNLYISKIDASGTLLWQKRVKYSNAVNSGSVKIHFEDINEINTSQLLLLAYDDEQVLIIKIDTDGNLIWVRQFYDKNNTQLYFNRLSFRPRLHTLSEEYSILVIQDIHSYNGGIRRQDYRFIKFQNTDAEIIDSKIIETTNPKITIRDQQSFQNTIVLAGSDGQNIVIFYVDINLRLSNNYKFSLNNSDSQRNNLHLFNLSSIKEGRFSAMGGYWSDQGNYIFVIDLDFYGLKGTNSIHISDKPWSQIAQQLERTGDNYIINYRGNIHFLTSTLDLDWTRKIEIASINKRLVPINLNEEYIYAYYSYPYRRGYYIISNSLVDYQTCETISIEDHINFEDYEIITAANRLVLNSFNTVDYPLPIINVETLALPGSKEICENPSDQPQIDIKQAVIRAKNKCILPGGMEVLVFLTLRDTEGNVFGSGGDDIVFDTDLGQLGNIIDYGNGVYSVDFSSNSTGIAHITASVNGQEIPESVQITVSKECIDQEIDVKLSSIQANEKCLAPNTKPGSAITIQLYDTSGNPIVSGGDQIEVFTSLGTLSSITDNGNGTYTCELFSSYEGIATVYFTINGYEALQTIEITISKQCGTIKPNADNSIIIASPNCVHPKEGQTILNVQLYDVNGNPVLNGGANVTINTSAGSISNVIDEGDGSYTATLTATGGSGAFISFSVDGIMSQNTLWVNFSTSCDISGGDLNNSHIKVSSDCIVPDGTTPTQVTVYLLDNSGNPLLVGGDNVEIQTTLGSITNTVDNNDGTYSAYLTSNQTGIATLTFLLNGNQAISYKTVVFSQSCNIGISLELSTIEAVPSCIQPDGEQQSTVTVQLVDVNGNLVLTGGQNVIIHSNLGNISFTTDNGNGTYSALLSSNTSGVATLSFSLLGENGAQQTEVNIKQNCEEDPLNGVDLNKSTINVSPNSIEANGQEYADIKVILRDQNNNIVSNSNNYTVAIVNNSNLGTVNPINAFIDPNNSSYNSHISSHNIGQAELGFSVNGIVALSTDTVQFVQDDGGNGGDEGTVISNTEVTWLQSPNFYLQAAGSQGNDSTKGIHLRWVLRGALGELHLPKRNYAENQYNFNKPNDVIRLYRTKYRKYGFTLNFQQTAPTIVDNNNNLWIYRYDQRDIYIYFRNIDKYNTLRNTINPLTNHFSFLQNYGAELIEVETKNELFFKATLKVSEEFANNGSIQVETLSVSENIPLADKNVSARETFSGASEILQMSFTCENGIAIRYKAYDCLLSSIEFEFYSDFLTEVNSQSDWWNLGDFALSKNDETVFNALEPNPDEVNANWLRFNDNEYVNIENYQKQWNGIAEPGDRNIKEVVAKYIELSNDQNNPIANESVPISGTGQEATQISNLDLLNMAAYDYHIARMLGLGSLDIDSEVFTDQYIYITEYVTFGDLQDGEGAREVQHLSMSLPTGISDERLPLPIDLKNIVPGVYYGYENTQPINLTDDDGYTYDGKARYVSLFIDDVPDSIPNMPFYSSYQEFSAHLYTLPIYGGLEYKMDNESNWRKPELSNTDDYQNILADGSVGANETVPLLIPEIGKPLYVDEHRLRGWYRYNSYAINWFYRATRSELQKSIYSDIKPNNSLIAPTNIKAVLVQPESPLILTSQVEQEMLGELKNDSDILDTTLVRLTYDYHAFHELVKYNVPNDSTISNQDYENEPDLIFPDDDEVFAESVDIYFRNQVPNNIRGKVISIAEDLTNPLLAILTTGVYNLASQGNNQQLIPSLQASEVVNYIGGILNIGENTYIIHSINMSGAYPQFKVYKTQVTDAITEDIPSGSVNPEELELPMITNDGLFMAVENMQSTSSWGNSNPLSTKILVGDNWEVHREVIEKLNPDGSVQRKLEKSRGIWSIDENNHTSIEKILEPQELLDANGNLQYELDEDGNEFLVTEDVHKGLYKITFHGIQLAHHPQYTESIGEISVDWDKGIARIFTESSLDASGTPIKSRKTLKVGKIENIGESEDLVIYVDDPDVEALSAVDLDPIPIGSNISVNFYPSYKVYLYEDDSVGLNEEIIPTEKDVDYSIFGVRSEDNDYNYFSPVSTPGMMMAQRIVLPEPPQQPQGSTYATRPDYFGRSTYTFTTEYNHQPYGLLFYRSNDELLLNSIYAKSTVQIIRNELKNRGGTEEPFFTDRWKNLVDIATIELEGDFREYDENGISQGTGYKFPNPDKQAFFDWINQILANLNQPPLTEAPGELSVGDPKIVDFFKGAIYNAFVPLTPLPIIYEHIQGVNYQPLDEKQNIKDKNGYALNPGHPDFKMAPMMKKLGNHKTQFIDFKLDGTSSNYYFYGVKEIGSQMKIGDFSPFLGPIQLVNTNAPEAPEVQSIKPILGNALLGNSPSIKIGINSYPEAQNIERIKLFRATSKLDAQSIRTMKLVTLRTLASEANMEEVWPIEDDFSDLTDIPFGDGLYYRVVVERLVKYADETGTVITEFAPSQASKILVSTIVETEKPLSPNLDYDAQYLNSYELSDVILKWNKMCYNGKYHLYKMNSQGNWIKIYQVQSNEVLIQVSLLDTELNSNTLPIKNSEGQLIYHHFKVITENTSGMLSTEENILTIPSTNYNGGIGAMQIDSSFIIE